MSLPFDISEKLKSVQVRHYVEWLGRDSHCGYGFAFGYDEKSYRLIDELFQMLQDVETDDEDGAKELWLCARRGTIDDFAKQYGTYEENLEDGTVKNQKEYEDYWKSEFPDEVEWYRFVAVEHTDIKYRCVFLSNKQVLEMDKRLESGYTHDISEFTEWLVDAVKLTIEAVRNGTYNESVARLLPYKHRTGVITRAGLWKLYPEEKESFFEALTQEDVDEFLATGTEDCTGLPELKEMTANGIGRRSRKHGNESVLFFEASKGGYRKDLFGLSDVLPHRKGQEALNFYRPLRQRRRTFRWICRFQLFHKGI